MKTPTQELFDIKYDELSKTDAAEWEEKEKEFARLCFEAGHKRGENEMCYYDRGSELTEPDFGDWYKQFEL